MLIVLSELSASVQPITGERGVKRKEKAAEGERGGRKKRLKMRIKMEKEDK